MKKKIINQIKIIALKMMKKRKKNYKIKNKKLNALDLMIKLQNFKKIWLDSYRRINVNHVKKH